MMSARCVTPLLHAVLAGQRVKVDSIIRLGQPTTVLCTEYRVSYLLSSDTRYKGTTLSSHYQPAFS
jgi:hypothetical protein